MRAAQINSYGGKEVLRVTAQAPQPSAGKGQVLVEVHAASVNPFDWKVREGLIQSKVQLAFPATLGGDMSGVVVEIGEDVADFEIGQEVYGQAGPLSSVGSFAEFAPARAKALARKPASVDFITAAAVPLTGTSAYQALVDTLQLQAGQKILIHGGAGGIGSFAVQLAKHLGAHVATTVAPEDIDFVKTLGADQAIDYTSQKFEQQLRGFDAVYDTIGGDTYTRSFEILKPGGQIVSMTEGPREDLMSKYQVTAAYQSSKVTSERLTHVAQLIDQGALKVTIDKIFPLDEAAEALDYVHKGHHRGKVIIKVKE